MIALSSAALVLPDRILSPGTLIIEGDRILEIREGTHPDASAIPRGRYIVPGFIDVHVHGVEGIDVLDGPGAVDAIAGRLPRYGTTSFCPTTVACEAGVLGMVLAGVRRGRAAASNGARVLPAHLESNFINPEYAGAQPRACLRSPRAALSGGAGADVLAEIDRAQADVAIVTIASELDGGLDLVRWLRDRAVRVSLGHSGAAYDQAIAAIAAGASQATHLFNRMPPAGHRSPGLAGAVLESNAVAAELICDGTHVHPAMLRLAIHAKRPSRIMAITDGTAGSGLGIGARTRLGGREIIVGEDAAHLADGTLAGGVSTMDRAFKLLVHAAGCSIVDAAAMCAATPARELGLTDRGVLQPDALADLVVLDGDLSVVETWVGGQRVHV